MVRSWDTKRVRATIRALDMEQRWPPREASATSAGVSRCYTSLFFRVSHILCTTDLLSFKKMNNRNISFLN
jgi:hypothetical protein